MLLNASLSDKKKDPSQSLLGEGGQSSAQGSLENDLPSYLLGNHLGHHVSCVDVDGADGHDLLPVAWCELTHQHGDEGVELGNLLPVVLLHGAVVALLQTAEGHAYVRCPPDLSAGQRHLMEEELDELKRPTHQRHGR